MGHVVFMWFSSGLQLIPCRSDLPIEVACESFRLSILQQGGPPLDPAKLHGRHEEMGLSV